MRQPFLLAGAIFTCWCPLLEMAFKCKMKVKGNTQEKTRNEQKIKLEILLLLM